MNKKIIFVSKISDSLVGFQTNIIEVRYEIYKHKDGYKQEYLVVEYSGGAKTVRNCNGNSYSAIFEELSKYLDHGYYDENEDYNKIINSPDWTRVYELC